MRTMNQLVFEDLVINTSSEATAFFTKTELNSVFGQADQLTWQAVLDNFTGTVTLSTAMEHSADGRNWSKKSGSTDATATLTAPGPLFAIGFDQGSTPSLTFVRFAIFFGNTAHSGRVRLYVTARDGRV